MKFLKLLVNNCENCILGHNIELMNSSLRKGTLITLENIKELNKNNVSAIYVAKLDPSDITENDAAKFIASLLIDKSIVIDRISNGRANLYAKYDGMFITDQKKIYTLNKISESVALATLKSNLIVKRGQLVANVKIIPFSVKESLKKKIVNDRNKYTNALSIKPFIISTATLICTQGKKSKKTLLEKTKEKITKRLSSLNVNLVKTNQVNHSENDLSQCLIKHLALDHKLILIHGYSSIVDKNDIIPKVIKSLGGKIIFYGMPVDPGNLLLLGKIKNIFIIGVPGCAKSPRENGFDWVLENICCGQNLNKDIVAKMGNGGLLKEQFIKNV